MIGETSVTKKCAICGEIKPIEEFSKSYPNRCKKCVAEHTRSVRVLNRISKDKVYKPDSIDEQLALELINTSVNVLMNDLEYMFNNFPQKDRIIEHIILSYRKEMIEWLNDKTKDL